MLTVEVGAGPLVLTAERAAFVPGPGLLLIADAHLGKAQAFRRLGVPVPGGTTAADLARLDALIRCHAPRELVFLGDLLHAPQSRSPGTLAAVATWRRRHAALPMRLIRGNHDHRAGDPPADWDIAIVDEPWCDQGWAMCHHPQSVPGHYALAGHVHPGVSIGQGVDRLRLPCFHLRPQDAVLPAFGAFTGLHTVRPAEQDRVAVIADGAVRLVRPSRVA